MFTDAESLTRENEINDVYEDIYQTKTGSILVKIQKLQSFMTKQTIKLLHEMKHETKGIPKHD